MEKIYSGHGMPYLFYQAIGKQLIIVGTDIIFLRVS